MGSPAGARAAVAASLAALLPDVTIIAAPRATVVNSDTLMLAISALEPASVACPYPLVTLDCWVITPYQSDDGGADDSLDTLLGSVLEGVAAVPGLRWVTAQRGVWNETQPAYNLTLETQL